MCIRASVRTLRRLRSSGQAYGDPSPGVASACASRGLRSERQTQLAKHGSRPQNDRDAEPRRTLTPNQIRPCLTGTDQSGQRSSPSPRRRPSRTHKRRPPCRRSPSLEFRRTTPRSRSRQAATSGPCRQPAVWRDCSCRIPQMNRGRSTRRTADASHSCRPALATTTCTC